MLEIEISFVQCLMKIASFLFLPCPAPQFCCGWSRLFAPSADPTAVVSVRAARRCHRRRIISATAHHYRTNHRSPARIDEKIADLQTILDRLIEISRNNKDLSKDFWRKNIELSTIPALPDRGWSSVLGTTRLGRCGPGFHCIMLNRENRQIRTK